jgi:Cu-processing system ATP-binding protein
MIRLENVSKKFKKLQALDDVSVEFSKGQVTALIGPNGSGKTTLIKSILGMVRPDSGNIYFDQQSIVKDEKYRGRIGYMPQIGRYPDNMTVQGLIRMISDIRNPGANTDDELFNAFQIESIGQKTMQSLSGGTRQKVNATLAFLFDPPVLILDEPTAGLDPVSSEILKEKIIREKRRGKLILITSHILSDLEEVATNIVYLQEGRILFSDSLENIREYTGQARLGKAIAQLMRQNFMNKTYSPSREELKT